jgi:hypothetical protein
MPVTRHPPYSPGRAVFPPPVLRLYARPRCKAQPSGKHSPTWHLCKTRTRYLDAVEDLGALRPRVTALLTSPPAGGAPPDAGHAVPLWSPEARASQQGAAPLLARRTTAAPLPMRLLRCDLEVAFSQPFGQPPQAPFRVLLQAEGPHPVSGIAAPPCFAPTAWLHHFFQPQSRA